MKTNGIFLAAGLLAVAALFPAGAFAASGTVVDREGKPVAEARACLMVGGGPDGGGSEGLCDDTDERGVYRLPDPRTPLGVRIVADGFLPATVAAVDQETPVVLDRAATLFVRVLDAATGLPVAKSEVEVVYTSGERKGPFPANRAGVRVKSLPPGNVIPRAAAAGYAVTTAPAIDLVAGKETALDLRLQPE